jgi:hypothetical protein
VAIITGVQEQMWRLASGTSLVIRADFGHPQAWEEVRAAIAEPQTEDEFVAHVQFVDDRAYEGLTATQLLAMAPPETGQRFAFLVDTVTLTLPDHPVLVVNLYDYVAGVSGDEQGSGPSYGDTFRVVPSAMWSVQNNLSISNMDWAEFAAAVDADGVFRGFR